MDPILKQKTVELFKKLMKARAAGANITPDDIERWMRRETKGKYGLADAQGYVATLGESGGLRALLSGSIFNTNDEIAGLIGGEDAGYAEKLRDKAYSARHPLKAASLKTAGAILTPALIAALAPAGVTGAGATGTAAMLRSAAAGAAGAGLAELGASEAPTFGGRVEDAIPAAVAGALPLPAVALKRAGTGLAKRAISSMLAPAEATGVNRAAQAFPRAMYPLGGLNPPPGPNNPVKNFVAPFAAGNAIVTLFEMLSQGLPEHLGPQPGAQ